MTHQIDLHIKSDPLLLTVIRANVEKMCQIAGYQHLEASKIVLAVDEACANVMKHAYQRKKDQPIDITIMVKLKNLEIVIFDEGKPINLKEVKPRNLDDLRPGGLGVFLMKNVMDKVQFSRTDDNKNKLVMTKQLPKRN